MSLSAPIKFPTPFCASGSKNTIPATTSGIAQPYNASLDVGFPAITAQPIASGGLPPDQKDFNGILYELTQAVQYQQAGANFVYDSTFATAISGYPLGAIVQATDGSGFWVNISSGNTNDPEALGSNWLPLAQAGFASVSMSSSNITLTALQAGKRIIVLSGTLTAALNLIFPAWQKEWMVINNTTGNYTITAKTSSGSGVVLTGGVNSIYSDATNIYRLNSGFGSGQTPQQRSSPALSTVYTNTSSQPIYVAVTVGSTSVGGGSGIMSVTGFVTSPGGSPAQSDFSSTAIGSGANEGAKIGFFVPSGWSYYVTASNTLGNGTGIQNWTEYK